MSFPHLSLVFFLAIRLSAALNPILPEHCPCGYVDRTHNRLFTDAIIVYFNETQAIDPDVFINRSFEDKKEKGWFSIFRCGGNPSNVRVGNTSNLELFVDKYTPNHLVNGSELRTVRQDIQYGSFRASMRSPPSGAGGSALSMVLKYNGSESLELDILNMDNPGLARITNLVNGELPAEGLAVNYTVLQDGLGTASSVNPWDFVDYRMDWTDYDVAFWANTALTREVSPTNRTVPVIPQPLYLKHWSTGDSTYMQGPPSHRSMANVAWIRMFFNSSLMTAQHHRVFDSRCQQYMACSMENPSLRGSTPYKSAAKMAFKNPPRNEHLRIPAAIVAGSCSIFGVFCLVNSTIRTLPWRKLGRAGQTKERTQPNRRLSRPQSPLPQLRPSCESERGLVDPAEPDFLYASRGGPYSGQSTPHFLELYTPGSSTPWLDSGATTKFAGTPYARSRPISIEPFHLDFNAQAWTTSSSRASSIWYGEADNKEKEVEAGATLRELLTGDEIMPIDPGVGIIRAGVADELYPVDEKVDRRSRKNEVATSSEKTRLGDDMGALTALPPVLGSVAMPIPAQQRVDYLAGLVALACLLVSIRHFVLTFWPYVVMGYGNTEHFVWERWAYIFFGGYFLTPLWIGPFFITSSRFLSARYLREGNLADVAKKMLLRGPRLLIPVAIVAMLEYFFISLGLVDTLVWLPSISWSTWPYVTPQANFGVFVNNIVQLAYFIPNGAPEITNYFCVGVLWTIPVQLQFSYVILLSAVMIRDMKNPWKRFAYYTCCTIFGWYARSWSACFWTGLLLTDVDVTYGWIKWTQSRPRVLYTVLVASTMVILGTPLFLVFNIRYSFMINEADIHPDVQTGLSLGDTPRGGYPNYFEPYLAILLFSTFIQIIADLSIWIQKFLSIRPLLLMRRHVMTLYLVHGFIFWSLGAWLCVTLSVAGIVPYWANLLITLLICYVVIAVVTTILTPLLDFTTMSTIKNVWRWASEEPVPKRPTTGKFSKALVLDRSNLEDPTKEA